MEVKILVLGAAGMAGHVITRYLREHGYDVDALSRSRVERETNIVCDLLNTKQLASVLDKEAYDVIINSAGLLNQNAEKNKKEAIYINAYLPNYLADRFKDEKTRVIHLSTDCVFSGKNGPYTENSICDGDTVYDRTKALGELWDEKNVTLRMSIIGPDRNRNGIGLFHWFMQQRGEIKGYTQAYWSGITTITLAKAIEQVIEKEVTGLYHLSAKCPISKYELCQLFNKYFRNGSINIKEDSHVKINKVLINTREEQIYSIPSYEEMVAEMKEWIILHKSWYPMYEVDIK